MGYSKAPPDTGLPNIGFRHVMTPDRVDAAKTIR
jgi:hypothetical protein